jgi:hypothetical protein
LVTHSQFFLHYLFIFHQWERKQIRTRTTERFCERNSPEDEPLLDVVSKIILYLHRWTAHTSVKNSSSVHSALWFISKTQICSR